LYTVDLSGSVWEGGGFQSGGGIPEFNLIWFWTSCLFMILGFYGSVKIHIAIFRVVTLSVGASISEEYC
jgi:hypothetical protein